MAEHRFRAALEAFSRAVELDPLSAEAHRRLGFSAVQAGELKRAVEAWTNCLRLTGGDRSDDSRVARVVAAARVLEAELTREENTLA